jgi:hypothetical protein
MYERMTGGIPYKKTEPKVPPQAEGPDNSFLAWFTSLQERDAKLSAPRDEPGALPLKSWPPKEDTSIPWKALRQIVQVHLDWAHEVEHAIVTQGGKTAKELNPKLLESETSNAAQTTLFGMPQNTPFPLVQSPNPSDSVSKQPSSPVTYGIFRSTYQTEPVATHLVESYAKLFEACWKGDVATIEMLCLPQKSGKRNKDITYLQVASQIAPTSLEPSGLFGFGYASGNIMVYKALFADPCQDTQRWPSRSLPNNGKPPKQFLQSPKPNMRNPRSRRKPSCRLVQKVCSDVSFVCL